MIKNERQYRITKAQMRKFEGALAELAQTKDKNIHPLLQKAHQDALRSQYEELHMQLKEYDALVEGKRDVLERLSPTDLPRALIWLSMMQHFFQQVDLRGQDFFEFFCVHPL